ncbi:Oidioi.mRNA.OKI2018_I69.chr2.g6649.t1.cds [Oikopleura dioica]|uniref:chitinase n=1 Tax=Oikopleura dioica TaxID=34765 RepID=A0ABN7T8H4_OIKDI|nr:Oidioi.mRNA.OKI2018_I69.chr2.g6649.t1.cds [Oikopleura dioica]
MKLFASTLVASALGHGRMLEPPARSSYLRLSGDPNIDMSKVTPNYNDNELFCGGFQHQVSNGYKCGVCGDSYLQARPRENEWGGKYGSSGLIPRTYESSEEIPVTIQLTAHHKGFFQFKICEMTPEMSTEDEDCFNSPESIMELADGSTIWDVNNGATGTFNGKLRLPDDLSCEHCVIQWRYHTGNSWGCDETGKCGLGLGMQEEFYGCADVKINPRTGGRPTSTATSPSPSSTVESSTSMVSTSPPESTTEPLTTTTSGTRSTIKTTTKSTTEDTTTPNTENCEAANYCSSPSIPAGIHKHCSDCSKFIQCANGITYIKDCPPGLLFNGETKTCDWPYNVTC